MIDVTDTVAAPEPAVTARQASTHSYLMCRPEHFTVSYRINPWMQPELPTSTSRALAQWTTLYETFLALGHDVQLIDPLPGLPDMVFAANGGFTIGNTAYGVSFTYPERQREAAAFAGWFRSHGFEVVMPRYLNEGEGDLLLVGDTILAGTGFRTDPAAHAELAALVGREVVGLQLVDPRFYHLDTALTVLDPTGPEGEANVAYLPGAFDDASRELLARRYPDAVRVGDEEGSALGLNAISDGLNVVMSPRAPRFADELRARGYHPIPVDLSELLLGGGGVKCCTLELRR